MVVKRSTRPHCVYLWHRYWHIHGNLLVIDNKTPAAKITMYIFFVEALLHLAQPHTKKCEFPSEFRAVSRFY